MSQTTICLIQQTHCGRIAGEPVCPKCGIRADVRYVSKEDMDMAVAKGTALYWQNHAQAMDKSLKPGQVFQDLPIAPQMVVLPSGSYLMGSAENDAFGFYERPQHKVTIAYQLTMGLYPVTFEEWDACLADGGVNYRPENNGWRRRKRPVINVSWDDVKIYIDWLNQKLGISQNDPSRYRLPSEAEWEYGCRAGSQSMWCFGDGFDQLKEYAWYDRSSGAKSHPVGQKKANAFGLYDMHGNVHEWLQDWYHEDYTGAPSDGSAWLTGGKQEWRVVRGGSWRDLAGHTRAATRSNSMPDSRCDYVGFRLARTMP